MPARRASQANGKPDEHFEAANRSLGRRTKDRAGRRSTLNFAKRQYELSDLQFYRSGGVITTGCRACSVALLADAAASKGCVDYPAIVQIRRTRVRSEGMSMFVCFDSQELVMPRELLVQFVQKLTEGVA